MQAGELRHQVVVQQLTETQDTYGDTAPAEVSDDQWSTFATRWAKLEPLQGREFLQAGIEQAQSTIWITMRYLAGVTPKMRVAYGSRLFDILSVNSDEQTHRETKLFCKERL